MKTKASLCLFLVASFLACRDGCAQQPTLENVPYGSHPRQQLDFYKAKSAGPAPLFFFMHSGGWMNGDKKEPPFLSNCLAAGISVVSINYRFIPDAAQDKVTPPLRVCLADAARALQFVRSRAREWNLDPQKVCVSGASAGGFMALWLAFHPDLADPKSADPVAHESTRVTCALTMNPQTSLDPLQMRNWVPNNDYGHHAFLLPSYQDFLAKREQLMPWIKEFSPYELATADDPPVYLYYDTPPTPGQPAKDPPHSANLGVGLAEKLRRIGLVYELNYPGAPAVQHPNMFTFVTAHLVASAPAGTVSQSPSPTSSALFDLDNLTSVKTEHTTVNVVNTGAAKALQVAYEAGVQYANVEFSMGGEKDFSACAGVEADITNTGATDAMVAVRIDDAGDWQIQPFNSEVDSIAPGATKTIRVTFGQSYGAKGYAIDPTRITRALIIVASPKQEGTLQINRFVPFGTRADLPKR